MPLGHIGSRTRGRNQTLLRVSATSFSQLRLDPPSQFQKSAFLIQLHISHFPRLFCCKQRSLNMQIPAQQKAAHEALVGLYQNPSKFYKRMKDIEHEISRLCVDCREVKASLVENEKSISRHREKFSSSIVSLEMSCMKYVSHQLQKQTKILEKVMALLGHELIKIKELSKENEKQILRTTNFLSPFYALPTELIRYILLLCKAPPYPSQPKRYSYANNTVSTSGQVIPTQALISQVSTRFRSIALGSPELWTNLKIDLSNKAAIKQLPVYLNLSATKTIHLTIHATGREVFGVGFKLAWNSVVLHISRVGTLNLIFEGDILLKRVLNDLKDRRAPRLTAFKAQCNIPPVDLHLLGISHTHRTCFLKGAPSLKSLNFRCILPGKSPWNSGICRMHLQIPLSNISSTWLPVFSSFSGLVALSIEDWHLDSFPPAFNNIILPHLRFLKFRPGATMQDTLDFLTIVQMPELESLSVVWHSGTDVVYLFCALSFYYCQAFPLLHLLSFWFPNQQSPSELRTHLIPRTGSFVCNPFEYVEQVAFVGLSSIDLLLHCLFTQGLLRPVTGRLPRLKSLSIGADDLDLMTVEHIISNRRHAGFPIPRIEVNRPIVNPMWGLNVTSDFSNNMELSRFNSKKFVAQINSMLPFIRGILLTMFEFHLDCKISLFFL
ncbi:hypothetical protein BDQ17DRAFT_1541888 [Cyathus striatus]|nr:hypothetical protein BDQ17DRAFT_1541888 [Cyathus striatus]